MIEKLIDFVKKNKLIVICFVIIVITYCNKKKSLENFSSEYPNFIDTYPCNEEKNKDMEHCKRGGRCETDIDCANKTINKDGTMINLNYCTPSKSRCNLMNTDSEVNNFLGKTCAECIYDSHCKDEKKCFSGICKEMEKDDSGYVIEGTTCGNTNQCGSDMYCKTNFKNYCVGKCRLNIFNHNNLTCEKREDCKSNENGKTMCSKENTCISETEYNFYDMKERYEQLYDMLKDLPNFTKIKNCLEKIVSENNEVDNSDVGVMLMYKLLSKYFHKLRDVYTFIFSTEIVNNDKLIDKIEEVICTA